MEYGSKINKEIFINTRPFCSYKMQNKNLMKLICNKLNPEKNTESLISFDFKTLDCLGSY